MITHCPTTLRGPITRSCDWWPRKRDITSPMKRAMAESPSQDWRNDPEIRVDLVERVRREIAEGTYETPEKWQIALDRLAERLEQEP
ncbi:MAG: hypothetical protein KatS3mg105_3508 [Gemmatales bacterium]|nr:MAG: hypothetical protein KatS3mg105_3508 [Gemmatales bacterium]